MKFSKIFVAIVASTPLLVQAAALERSQQQVAPLFEEGNYAQLYFARVIPIIEGTDIEETNISDIATDYNKLGLAVKVDANSNTAFLLQYHQPWGVDIDYTNGVLQSTKGKAKVDTIDAITSYKPIENLRLYGGVSYEKATGNIQVSKPIGQTIATTIVLEKHKITNQQFINIREATQAGDQEATNKLVAISNAIERTSMIPSSYVSDFDDSRAFGLIAGAAYEIPKIALRADLTYRSATKHKMNVTESVTIATDPVKIQTPAITSVTHINYPQSLNANLQLGIMADTLLLTKLRWVNWKSFDVAPNTYKKGTGGKSLTQYDNDQISGSIGIGRALSDKMSASIALEYDTGTGEPYTALGPYGNKIGFSLSGKYKISKMLEITTGINYSKLGDAYLKEGDKTIIDFTGSNVFGIGTQVGFRF